MHTLATTLTCCLLLSACTPGAHRIDGGASWTGAVTWGEGGGA